MPVIPDPAEFLSASKKENEPRRKPSEERQKASATDHIPKGPQIPDDMPPKASKEEIEARMEELNKSAK